MSVLGTINAPLSNNIENNKADTTMKPKLPTRPEQGIATLVNTARYPINQSNCPEYTRLVRTCRQQLAETGCAKLEGFITSGALAAMASEAESRLPLVDQTEAWQNPYLSKDDDTLPLEHPVRQFHHRKNAFICRDRFTKEDKIDQLFMQTELLAFLRECLSMENLYQYEDPMSGYLINVQADGETFPWHFDTNEFTISVMLQSSEAGGVFEYIPSIRNAHSENYAAVTAAMEGARDGVITLPLKPGDLQIFKGRYSLHRVTKAKGFRPRFTAIFGYSEQPGVVSKASRKLELFGRCLDAHVEAEALGGVHADGLRD